MGFLRGVANVQSYEEEGIPLSPWERVNLFGRGFFSFLGVYPHPESIDQYINESAASAKLIQHVMDFLRKSKSIDTYVSGLGHVSKVGKDKLIVMPGHCSGNLNEPKPDLGEEWSFPVPGVPRRKWKKVHKMSRKTPSLVSSDTEYAGVPAYDPETEPSDSGLDADHIPYILENMLSVQNKTRVADSERTYLSYYDLSLCNEGTLVGSEAKENIFDASQISAEKIHFSEGVLESKTGTETTQLNIQNVNVFIGRNRAMDTVNCNGIFDSGENHPYVVIQ